MMSLDIGFGRRAHPSFLLRPQPIETCHPRVSRPRGGSEDYEYRDTWALAIDHIRPRYPRQYSSIKSLGGCNDDFASTVTNHHPGTKKKKKCMLVYD